MCEYNLRMNDIGLKNCYKIKNLEDIVIKIKYYIQNIIEKKLYFLILKNDR